MAWHPFRNVGLKVVALAELAMQIESRATARWRDERNMAGTPEERRNSTERRGVWMPTRWEQQMKSPWPSELNEN